MYTECRRREEEGSGAFPPSRFQVRKMESCPGLDFGGGGGKGEEALSVEKGLEEVGQNGGVPLIPPEETLFSPATHF